MRIDKDPLVRQLRERLGFHADIYVNDTIALPVATCFTFPGTSSVTRNLVPALIALFRTVTGKELDVHTTNRMAYPRVAWGVPKEAWLTTDGYGLLLFLHNFGALPSDGVDTVFKLVCPNGCQLTTWVGHDYILDTLTCRINGPTQKTVDVLAEQARKRFIE